MNIQSSRTLYFLQADTHLDRHDTLCSCREPQPLPHWGRGASLYKLDVPGLQALNNSLMEYDDVSFNEWLDEHEPLSTSYGSGEEDAVAEPIEQGMLVVNYPEYFPWIVPLASTLRDVVGYGGSKKDGVLSKDVCQCDNTQKQNKTVCCLCYARLVCNILWAYLHLNA